MSAKRDPNFVPSAMGETDDANRTPTPFLIDPITGRVLVDVTGVGTQGGYGGPSVGYTFSTTTTDADPGSGKLRLDNADPTLATKIYADNNNDEAVDITAWLATFDDSSNPTNKGVLKLFKKTDTSKFAIFYVTALTVDSGYYKLTVTYIAGNSTFSDTDPIVLSFMPIGDRGATGATGSTGSTGATGATGPAGAGRRSATLVIAASDSKDVDAASSDYQCDGTDDDVQILAAIAALPSGGGHIVLMEGTFTIGASIVITKSNVVLEGQGAATIIKLANTKNIDCVQLGDNVPNSYTQITVKNLKIDGNMANQTTYGHGINIWQGLTGAKVQNCWIINTYYANIYDNGSSDALIEGNYLDTVKVGSGWSNIEGVGKGARIIGNFCNAGDYANIAIYNDATGTAAKGIIVDGNTCTNSNVRGIENSGAWNATVSNNLILNATKEYLYANYPNSFIGNTCVVKNNPTASIIKVTASDPQIVNNNQIFHYIGSTAGIVGIEIDTNAVTCVGNLFQNERNYVDVGIQVNANKQYLNISGNILNDYYTNSGGIGIDASAGPGNSIFNNNCILGFYKPMDFTGCIGVVISGNQISNTGENIPITNGSELTISDNFFEGSGITAVNTARKDAIVITGNTFASGAFVTLQGIGYSIISNNKFYNSSGTNSVLITSTGTAYSIYNTLVGNNISNTSTNGIKENSANDGPNIILGNIVKGPTNPIVTAHANTDASHNITT